MRESRGLLVQLPGLGARGGSFSSLQASLDPGAHLTPSRAPGPQFSILLPRSVCLGLYRAGGASRGSPKPHCSGLQSRRKRGLSPPFFLHLSFCLFLPTPSLPPLSFPSADSGTQRSIWIGSAWIQLRADHRSDRRRAWWPVRPQSLRPGEAGGGWRRTARRDRGDWGRRGSGKKRTLAVKDKVPTVLRKTRSRDN